MQAAESLLPLVYAICIGFWWVGAALDATLPIHSHIGFITCCVSRLSLAAPSTTERTSGDVPSSGSMHLLIDAT